MATAEATREFSAGTKELGDKIVDLTLKQAKELSDYLEEVHGIKPAAGGAVMMAAPGGGGAAAAAAEAQDRVRRRPGRLRRQEDRRDQGRPRRDQPGPEGSQGPGRRRAQQGQGRHFEGRRREAQEGVGRSRRHGFDQVGGTKVASGSVVSGNVVPGRPYASLSRMRFLTPFSQRQRAVAGELLVTAAAWPCIPRAARLIGA